MTPALGTFEGDGPTITPDLGDVAFREWFGDTKFRLDANGQPQRVCAACDHTEDKHCRKCGCNAAPVKTDDECPCAKFVETISKCPHCGHMFGEKWQLQNHLMPTPTCLVMGLGAAGKYADKPHDDVPLKPLSQTRKRRRR